MTPESPLTIENDTRPARTTGEPRAGRHRAAEPEREQGSDLPADPAAAGAHAARSGRTASRPAPDRTPLLETVFRTDRETVQDVLIGLLLLH
jgi:hypothetical protein